MWTEQSKERLGCADPVGGEGEEHEESGTDTRTLPCVKQLEGARCRAQGTQLGAGGLGEGGGSTGRLIPTL